MMKKNGFTLAEVLITLAIIGVVASLTLPSLITNTGEQQYKTALRKGVNTLTEAAQMNQSLEGFGYSDLTTNVASSNLYGVGGALYQSLYSLLRARTNVVGYKAATEPKGVSAKSDFSGGANNDKVIFFKDGTSISFPLTSTFATTGRYGGFYVTFDANGAKGPNSYSNCTAVANLATWTPASAAVTYVNGEDGKPIDFPGKTACNDKSKRVIKDRFMLRLVNGEAVAADDASAWVLEN